jgi:hypothetical protein
MHTNTTPPAGHDLAARLVQQVYVAGVPAWIDPATAAADKFIVENRLRCPACRKRHLVYQPYHRSRPRRSYRVCCRCAAPGCGQCSEF